MSKHRCCACASERKRQRAGRIKARGVRVVVAPKVDPGACPKHLAWIRSLPCAVKRAACRGPREAHHVRLGTGAGTGLKPADRWAVSLCAAHHQEGHRTGWQTFAEKYQIDLRFLACELAARSPYLTAEPVPDPD